MEARLDYSASAPAGYPHRIVARLVSDLIIDVVLRINCLHDFNIDRAFVFLSILQSSNCGDWRGNAEFAGQSSIFLRDEFRRPISISAISEGLRLPHETARRHVMSLMETGACIRQGRLGFMVPRAFEASAPMTAFYGHAYDAMRQLVENCHGLGLAIDPLAGPAIFKRRPEAPGTELELKYFVARKVIDYVLRVCIDALPVNIRLIRGLLFIAVMRENIQHITYDPNLAWKYSKSNEPPPDELRRPVSMRRLSQALSLPYTTVNRYVRIMTEDGVFIGDHRGIIIPETVMQKTEYLNNGTRLYYWFVMLIQQLKANGFEFLGEGQPMPTGNILRKAS